MIYLLHLRGPYRRGLHPFIHSATPDLQPLSLYARFFASNCIGGTFEADTSVKTAYQCDAFQDKNPVCSYEGRVSNKYSIGDAPNGGYLSVLAIRASRMYAEEILQQNQPHPISLTCYFNNKAIEGAPANISVEHQSSTKSTFISSVKIIQENTLRCSVSLLFSNLDKNKGLTNISPDSSTLDLPPLSKCFDASSILRPLLGKKIVRLQNEIDIMIPPSDPFNLTTLERARSGNLFATSPVGTVASQSGYVRFAGGVQPLTVESLVFFCDALPPPILNVSPSPWVPTLEYTVNVLDKPDPEKDQWLRFVFSSPYARNGLLITEGRLFSQDGLRLLAVSRQLAKHISMPTAVKA